MLKKEQIPRNTIKLKFTVTCTSLHYVPNTYKVLRSYVHEYVQQFKRSCAYKLFITCTLSYSIFGQHSTFKRPIFSEK